MHYFFICLLGLVIGSFLNVCIYRIPREKSIVFPGSHCTNCGHKLILIDLIPVFSCIFLKGRCRYCKEKISLRYPSIEVFNAILYIIIYFKFGFTIMTIKYCTLISILIVVGVIDYDTQCVFTSITVISVIIGIIFIMLQTLIYKTGFVDLIIGGVVGFLCIWIIVYLTKGMGTGDIEISAVCGMFLGVKGILLGLFLAILIGGTIGIVALGLRLKKAKEKIAFGPCIATGSLISIVWGNKILEWYLNAFI